MIWIPFELFEVVFGKFLGYGLLDGIQNAVYRTMRRPLLTAEGRVNETFVDANRAFYCL